MKSKVKNKEILMIIGILIIIILLILLIFLTNKKEEKFVSEPVELKFDSRVEKLNSFDAGQFYKFGWLQVQGTHIDLPILDFNSNQHEDNISYSYGWMSPSYKTGENRKVLMGHNIVNVSSTPMLPDENMQNFEELMAFSYYDFAKDNLYIQYTENGKDEIYRIYAIGFYDYGDGDENSFSDKEEIKEYIQEATKRSIYDYDIEVNETDELLTLKVCTRYFGVDEKQAFMIDARKLRKNEKVETYQVKKNKNYNDLIKVNENM